MYVYYILIIMYGSCPGSNVITKQRGGNYLLHASSYCKHNTENRNYEIRLSTVKKITNDEEYYKDFIVDLPVVNSTEDY